MSSCWILVMLCSVAVCKGQESDCAIFTDLDFPDAVIGTKLHVRLLLYTRLNLDCGLELRHQNLSSQPLFNLSRPTTFVIHGYRPTGAPPEWLSEIVRLLAAQDDMNILLVDWNRGATNINYFMVVSNTRKAAENLTAFVQNMQEHGASLSSIHIIGVSLGAHISGFVGANMKGEIGRITALDPAGPMFTDAPPEDRLDPTDAQFVDVLHTDMDALGFRKPLGHIDFYPNGGADQPGCPKTILSGKAYFQCDHQRSVYLFLSSMNKTCNITAYPCSSYDSFLDGDCLDCKAFAPAPCPVLGYYVREWKDKLLQLKETKTYFSTTKETPFCRTSYEVDVMTWNQHPRWGTLTIRLANGKNTTEARIHHKASKFEKYTETRLLAQFDRDLDPIQKVSVQFSTGNSVGPRYKLRLLRIRLKALEHSSRPPLCRYDVILIENKEVSFQPIPCEDSNF